MEEKDNEAKRARTVRYEYHRDVEQVQSWICQAEGRVQDRNLEPQTLKEFLQELQCEIGLITDQMDRVSRHGQLICQRTRDEHEQQLVRTTLSNLTDQLQQVRSWLEEKKLQVGDSIDSWQRFLQLHSLVISWVDEKKCFLTEPLHLTSLVQARQKSQDYNMAVKSCKVATKNVSDMGKELSRISQVSSVGALADQMAEAEQSKTEVETQLQERSALLLEMTEEWEQCEKKLKDVKSWLEKARQTLDSPLNKKRPLRDQLSLREKMLGDVTIQKTKINMSIEKLQVHFRSGVTGSPDVVHSSTELIEQLDALMVEINQQCKTLEAAVIQLDQLQQEIQGLRAQVVQVDQQLRLVSSPAYSPLDRDKALAEQNALQSHLCAVCQQIQQLRMRMTEIDPYFTLADDGIERSLMAAAADWQSRAPMEPSHRHPAPLPIPQTSTDVQSIPPPRCDDVQSSVRETISTSTSAAALKSSGLLTLDKFSYADIAAGRRSPSVSRQTTFESNAELVETVAASDHQPDKVEPEAAQLTQIEDEIIVPHIQEVHPGRSRWEQQQQEKLVQSDDSVAEPKHPSRSEIRRRAAGNKPKRPVDAKESTIHGSQERHPPITPVGSVDIQPQEETIVEEMKMAEEAAPVKETGTRPKVASTPHRSPSNLSPPAESEKRSRSPLWLPGSGGPSYADILRGHYISHQRGMSGIVDIPQQQQQKQEQLRRFGGESIDDTNVTEEVVVPVEEHLSIQPTVLPEVAEEVSAPVEVEAPAQPTTVDAGWISHHHSVFVQPIEHQQQRQVEYPTSIYHQPSNLSFETQYASAPDAEAVFAANFDMMALQHAYAQLAMPSNYPMPAFPVQETVNPPQNFEFNIEEPRQDYVMTSTPTPTAPQLVEPPQAVLTVSTPQIIEEPVEVTKPVVPSAAKLSYAQILAAGLQVPTESSQRRDSSGSTSGHTSYSPRPAPKSSPNVSDKTTTDSAPSPSRLSAPERGVSEPREPRSRQRLSKNSKSKSFDVREKEPSKPKMPQGSSSKLATLPGRSMEGKHRQKKKPHNESFSEDKQWTPVSVQVSPPITETLAAPQAEVARSKSPGGNPTSSEPEMTKAMMTFYGISSEDIEQLISSRSHDSDSEVEVAGVEANTEKKKKQVQKKKKRKSSKIPDEDEIEKALREISELEKNKRSKMRRTYSHEIKSSVPEVVEPKPQEFTAVNLLEVPEVKKRDKKLKKAASVSGAHPDKSSLKSEKSPLTESSTGVDSATSSSGSSDPSTHKQRRDRIKRGKAVSFNDESTVKSEPAVVAEIQPKNEAILPASVEPELTCTPVEPAQENEAEFLVLDSQGLESVCQLVTDVETMMEDAMSDDIVVLETENFAPSSPGPVEGHRTLDPQILEDVFTETASVFESHVCPEIYEEEDECQELIEEQVKEEPVAIPCPEPLANAEIVTKENQPSKGVLGPILVAEENKDDKIATEMTEELPLGSQPAAAMTLLPLEVRVTLRKISATSTVPFQPEEIQLRMEDYRNQPLQATESIDIEPAQLEITAAMVFNHGGVETVEELEQNIESPVDNAEVAGTDALTCISAIAHLQPVELAETEQLPMLARQVSLAEEEFADESELSLPVSTTPIPAMLEREEETLISATTEEPPTTKICAQVEEQELPSQEQMVGIVEALLKEPEVNLPEPVVELPTAVKFTVPVEALPTVTSSVENTTKLSPDSTPAGSSHPVKISVPLLTETPPEVSSVSSPGSDYKAPTSPFGFDDADHVVLSPQWMRQRSPLGRTFSLDPRSLSTIPKSAPFSPLVKAHSTDLSESYGTEEQKAAAAAKNLEEGSKSESQTGGEADDEDVEVYWRLREKKKKKKRRNPIAVVTPGGPRFSESSSDALSMAEHGPMSPLSVASDLPVSESTLTSDDEHRTKCTQDDGFQSGISTPILLSVASPDSELRETTPTELTAETESIAESIQETLTNQSIASDVTPSAEDIDSSSEPTIREEELVQSVEEIKPEVIEISILAGPCLLFTPEIPSESVPQDTPKTEETPAVETEMFEYTAPVFEESTVSLESPNESLVKTIKVESSGVPANSWANLVATGKPKISEPTPEPEQIPKPPRPLPTLIVVGEEEHHHEVPCDPEGYHIGRKERKWRKWRSSQSESQDVASDAETVETTSEAPLPSTSELSVEECVVAVKQVPPPSPAGNSSSESEEETSEQIRVVLKPKVQKVAKSIRELEQRKRRSRLSESEQEVLELAEAIAENRQIPCHRSQLDDNLRNIYLDSWPKHSTTSLDNSEKLLWIFQQSAAQSSIPENTESQSIVVEPVSELSQEIKEHVKEVENEAVPEQVTSEAKEILPQDLEKQIVLSAAPTVEEVPSTENEAVAPTQLEHIEEVHAVEPVVTQDKIEETAPQVEEQKTVQHDDAHPSVLSWATVVATSKPVITEQKEEVVEEPARPKRSLPTLIVVGEIEGLPVAAETDPDSFTEFVGRNERRRRKWRSSQSESQDYATDEETHIEPLVVKEEPEQQLIEPACVEPTVQCAVTSEVVEMAKEKTSSSDEEEVHDVHPARPKERKTKTPKVSIPLKEAEQRRRRARLSESERESLELAEAIERGEAIPSLTAAPQTAEKLCVTLEQSSQTTEKSIPENQDKEIEPIENEPSQNPDGIEEAAAPAPTMEDPQIAPLIEVEIVAKSDPNVENEEFPRTEIEPIAEAAVKAEPVAIEEKMPEIEESAPKVEDLEQQILQSEESNHPPVLSWATVVATSKPVITEKKEEVVEEPARPKRPLPTLIVVCESEGLPAAAETDPDSFTEFVCRNERRRRKWRSSQSESQDYTTDEETHIEPLVVKEEPEQQPIECKPVECEPPMQSADANLPAPVELVKEKDSDEEEVHDVHPARPKERKTKTPKVSIPLKETEQRRRKARLSESERESLELAEAIEHGDDYPLLHHDLHADSWPKDSSAALQNSEKLWVILQQSSQEIEESVPKIETIKEIEPIESEPSQKSDKFEDASVPAPTVEEIPSIEAEAVAEPDVNVEYKEIPSTEIEHIEKVQTEPVAIQEKMPEIEQSAPQIEDLEQQIVQSEEPVVPQDKIEETTPQVEEQQSVQHDDAHPSVLSWATVVATSKPVITESKEEVVEEPARPKRPLPTLIVVGESEGLPAAAETDPDSFTEFVGRNERRRRKWRSSQSESQDYATDEEPHVEPISLVVEVKPEQQSVEPIELDVQCASKVTFVPAKVIIETDSDEEEVQSARPKERKAKTAKVSIPLKETEQRRRRARLSESEKESLDLAEVIEHGEATPQLYYDLFADSWPHPFFVFLRDAESRWKEQDASRQAAQVQLPSVQESIQQLTQDPQELVSIQDSTPEQPTAQESAKLPQEEQSVGPSEESCDQTDQVPEISGWVIKESPEKVVPVVAKPLSWAAMVALSKSSSILAEKAPEPVEQIAPRPHKTPVFVVYSEEPQHPEPISSDDPDGFHECVSRKEKRRRKWRSSQSESQDADIVAEAEAVNIPESAPVVEPSQLSDVNVEAEVVSSQQPELHEKPDSKSKRAVVKVEKQTKEVERKRAKRLSESEREALQLAEAIESGQDVTNKCPVIVDDYWPEKLMYSDIEKSWQESLSVSADRLDDKDLKSSRDGRTPDSDPKGPSTPQPPSSDDSSDSSSRLPTTQNLDNIHLPGDRAIFSDESTYLSESQEDQQQNDYKAITTDLDEMLAELQQVEKDLLQFNSQQIKDRLPLIEAVMESLEEMEPRLIDVDNKTKNVTAEDPELDSLRAAVASLRARHITLESQACRYKQKLEDIAEAQQSNENDAPKQVAAEAKSNQTDAPKQDVAEPKSRENDDLKQDVIEVKSNENDDLQRYQALLSDLDDWVSSTHGQLRAELPKFTSVSAVLKEMDSSKRLEQDITKRNEQLEDLMKRCGTLQHSVAETEPLATQLYDHLCVLQRSFAEAGAQLHNRLLLLQACLVELEEKEVCIDIIPSPDPLQDDTAVIADDTPNATSARQVLLNDPIKPISVTAAECPINKDDDKLVTQSVVQKTIRVIRRTVLQNGREISVEEQVEEEPAGGTVPLAVETKLIPPKRGYFRIPSPFGIVEEPNYQDEQHVQKDDEGTVEITDITDQYDDREASSSGPPMDQFIEIHEVLDDHQITEQPESSQKVIEVFSPNEDVTPQSQSRTVFETLHEQEEEPEHDESTEIDSVETTQMETKVSADEPSNIRDGKDSEPTPQVEPELTDEFQQSNEEVTFQMVIEVQQQPAEVLEEGLIKEPDNKTSSEPTTEVIQPAEPELKGEFQEMENKIEPEIATQVPEDTVETFYEELAKVPEADKETSGELVVADEAQPRVETVSPITEETLQSQPEVTDGLQESEIFSQVVTEVQDEPKVESTIELDVDVRNEPTVEREEQFLLEEVNQEKTVADPQEEKIAELTTQPKQESATELEKSPDSAECQTEPIKLVIDSPIEPTPEICKEPCDELLEVQILQYLEGQILQQLEVPEIVLKTDPECETKTEETPISAQQIQTSTEPESQTKGELQQSNVSEENAKMVKASPGSIPSSLGDESESEVDNMDWNVSPDDERQFDEYFKDERPSSAASDSSTSTDTTHLESILGEPIEDLEASISPVTETPDTSRDTPTQETMSSEVAAVEDIEAEKEVSCQTTIESCQETGGKIEETVQLPETKEISSEDEVEEIAPIPIEAEEEFILVEEISQQIPEPSDVAVNKDFETEKLVASEEKMPIELAKQLSQQLVDEVLKAVESHPSLERVIHENVIQTSPTDPSSSSENDQESSSSEDESGWWVVGSPERKEKTTEEPFEIVEKGEVTELAPNETAPQLDDIVLSTKPENQLAETVEELTVPLDSDVLQETISNSVKTESSTNVTIIRIGYEPPNEDQQFVETLSIESVKDDVGDLTVNEVQQVAETPSIEFPPDEKSDTMNEEQPVSVSPTIDSEKIIEMGEKILEVLPGIVEQLSNIETLIEDDEKDVGAVERSQTQEEESTKEKGDEWNTLTEHRELVAPTLGENTTGPPIDDSQLMEKVARLVSDRVAMGQDEAQQLELNTEWQEIQDLLVNRLSDQLRQGANSSTQTSSVRYLATTTQVTVDESVEERKVKLNDNLAALKTAVQRREVVVIQRIVITIVRTVTEWLETIEYRVYTIKQTKSMERRTEQIQSLCEEVRVVEESLNTLEEITEMAVEVVNEETKVLLHKCVKSLKQQMQSVSEVTKRSEGEIEHIRRQWSEYLDLISSEEDRIKDLMNQLKQLQSAETLTSQEKLVQLEDIETAVQERLEGVTQLLHSGHNLVKETPFYQMPESAYALLDTIKIIEEAVRDERNVVLHKAALTAEYRQTLQEFAEIVRLSEALSDSKLAARNPPEASQELEKRQRFLFCLSHFLQVLDTLEPHLDRDTRSLCQDLHAELVVHAGAILDRAVNRQEIVEMSLASWNHLELQWNQEDEWFRQLQIPDTSNVSSEAFVELTESLKDVMESMEHHRSVAAQLIESTRNLDCLFSDPGLETKFQERIMQLQEMINDTKSAYRRLLLAADHWNQFQKFASHIDPWLKEATGQLQMLVNKAERGRLSHEDCLQYWVVRAEAEEKQQEWEQAKTQLDRAVAFVSILDEDESRRFCLQIDESWIQLDRELQAVEKALLQGLAQQADVPLDDRLICIECSHARIQSALDQLPVKYGSPEETTTRRKELQALYNFTEWQLKEISALGASNPHLAADRAEHLGVLARRTKEMTNAIHLRLEKLRQVHQWMISFQRLYSVTSRRLQEVFICLQKASIYRDPLWLAQAAQLCEESERELQSIDVEAGKLQRHLEVCPKDGVTAAVDENSFVESILQLDQSRQRSRDLLQLTRASVAERLERWKLFEDSVNRVLCLIKRLKYARNMATIKGSADLQHLLSAKQSIETIHEELTTNQHLVSQVGLLAEPFEPLAGERAADVGVQWTELESSLDRLSNCYGHAAADWMGIEAELDDIQQWCLLKLEWTQHSVTPGEEDETLAQIQAIGEELLVQQERLERSRLAASELGRAIAMSPVVMDNSIISVVGADATSASMPVSLASTAEHVAQQLQLLQQSMSVLADIAERQSSAVSNCNGTILSAEKLINTARQTLCTVEEDAAGERIEDQLVVLRDQLLQLSPTEQQLNSAPISEQLPVTVEIRPQAALCATTSTIQTTLQQWEIIFQKTFSEYERLLNKLQDRCDESATAQVWRDHLDQAEKYLSRSLPDQYLSTCEDRDLCELHENLLIRHHSVFQSTQSSNEAREVQGAEPTEEVIEPKVACNLQGLHQAVLTRIRLRHAALSDRALAWEQYRSSLSKLLTWLDAAERERKHLVLRQIQEHGLPTALHRVEVLLDKIGQGQRIQAELDRAARQLLEKLGDEESASTVRADLKSAAARLTDLEAGLCTWRDFLQRVARLYQNLEKGVEGIRQQLQSVQTDLVADNELPTSPEAAAELLQHYREQLLMVQTLSSDVEKQEVVAGEIRSCVNIPDAKRIWQRLAALQIRRSETEDRLNSLIQMLEEHQDWPKVFEMRYARFISWASTMEQRLLHKQRALVDDMVQRLSGPLRDELSAKECEQRWLVDQGRELSLVCSNQERRDEILSKVANVEEIWRKLMETWNQELQRLRQLPTDLDELNNSLAELAVWLGQAEATINAPLTILACNQSAVESRVAEHRDLENSIEQKRSIVASVLNLCNTFTANYTLLHGWLGTDLDAVQCATQSLQRRWKSICQLASERSALLESLWPDWSAVLELHGQLDQTMSCIEQATPSDTSGATSIQEVEQLSALLENLIQELHAPVTRQKLDQLNERYCILARDGRVDAAGELQQIVARLNARWRDQSDRLSSLLHAVRDASSLIHHWQGLRDRLLVWCSHCEVQVQQIENNALTGETDAVEVLRQLSEDLQVLENARAEIRELGRALIKQGTVDMQPQLEEYLQTEDEVLLKMAQMQVRLAQKEQDQQQLSAVAASIILGAENISLSDSGIYSYPMEKEALQGAVSSVLDDSAISLSAPDGRKTSVSVETARAASPSKVPSSKPIQETHSVSVETVRAASPFKVPATKPIQETLSFSVETARAVSPSKVPPSKPIEETQVAATGAKQRTYADVAKTAVVSSPYQRSTPPPVSVKSDTQRHLELALDEWRQRLARLDHSIKTSISTEPSTDAANEIARMVATCRSSHDLTQHLCNRLVTESPTNESRLEALTRQTMVLQEEFQQLEMLAKSKERNLRDERKTWAQQEQDLWRLERWLEHAENQFRTHERIPTNMEQLEDTVQDFRELSLDLDSHKNIVMSLNIVVNHVAEHAVTADQRAADRLRSRLAAANSRWDAVCKSAARIQARLQSSLMQNEEYHRTIRDLVTWLERTETDIQGAEPIDLTVGIKQLKAQLTKFQDLYAQLSQFEPRVTSMREIADQVFAQSVEADSAQLRSKLAVLNDRLTSLLKICAQYKQLLDGALRNRGASVSPSTPSGLNLSGMSSPGCKSPRPSIVVLPSHESPSRASSPRVPRASSMDERTFTSTVHSNFAVATASALTPEREESSGSAAAAAAVDTSVLQRGYRFFGRVIRTALPIQAVMLLVLGVASLVPSNNSCMDANTFVDSLEFVLGYPDGAPPT